MPTENIAGNFYDKYTTSSSIERRLMSTFLKSFDAALEGIAPEVVIEVGCGEGRITAHLQERFPSASVVGLDLPDEDLMQHWTGSDLPMFFGDATCLPFTDKSVDLVVALEVLEHIPHPQLALRELARVCRGHAVLSVPREPIWRVGNMARGRYLRELGNTPGHVNHWSSTSFRRFVAHEFHVTSVSWPLPWTMVRAHPHG